MNNFNNSPDDSAYSRLLFMRCKLEDNLTMIQPILQSYSFSEISPAILDISSIKNDTILVLDTYFIVLVYYGEKIHNWVQKGLHKTKNYPHLTQLLEVAEKNALKRVAGRNPTPRYVITHYNGSQARFLLAKVNPAPRDMSYHSSDNVNILTDDVSMQKFIESLKKVVVSEETK